MTCLAILSKLASRSFLSNRHDVAEVAGLTSFSFGEDEESRYVMLFKKVGKYLKLVFDVHLLQKVFIPLHFYAVILFKTQAIYCNPVYTQ